MSFTCGIQSDCFANGHVPNAENGRFLERTMLEKNGESNPKTIQNKNE